MQIRHLIVHEIRKQAGQPDAVLQLSDNVLELDDTRVYDLLGKLDQSLENAADVVQGNLSSPEDALFPGLLEQYAGEASRREAFMTFSRETATALYNEMLQVPASAGGYLVYADYQLEDERRLSIFMVRTNEALRFAARENDYQLLGVEVLDTSRLALAARIVLPKTSTALPEGAALPLRRVQLSRHHRSQRDVSTYFIDWIGLENMVTSRELTHSFLDAIEHLPAPADSDTGRPMEVDQFQRAVSQYARKQPGQVVSIPAFDDHFYGPGDKPFARFVEENELPLPADGFRTDGRTFRGHLNLRAGANGLSLAFPREAISRGEIEIDEQTGRVTIISEELVERLLEQL
ncbi:MAG: nucleoid-associated protein [Saprospiraceae bacterium]